MTAQKTTIRNRIARALLRLAVRIDPPTEGDYDGDYVGCDYCDARVLYEDAVPAGDCYMCLACHEAWRVEAAKCEHKWDEDSNQHGDPGHCCHKCGMWTDTEPPPVIGFEKVSVDA